jgi:nitroreductase
MEALEALCTRRSVRRFRSDSVERSQIEKIVDAGRLAATANNLQPWEFVVVLDEATRKKIAGITDYGKFISQSPACIVTFCKETKYYLEDGSAATQNMLVAARALGLGSCWVAGDKKAYAEEIRILLGFPEGYKLISLVAIGHPADSPSGFGKRALKEVLHWEKYGT